MKIFKLRLIRNSKFIQLRTLLEQRRHTINRLKSELDLLLIDIINRENKIICMTNTINRIEQDLLDKNLLCSEISRKYNILIEQRNNEEERIYELTKNLNEEINKSFLFSAEAESLKEKNFNLIVEYTKLKELFTVTVEKLESEVRDKNKGLNKL